MRDERLKLMAEDVAAKLNGIIASTASFNGHVFSQRILDTATEKEIMFFYYKLCLNH